MEKGEAIKAKGEELINKFNNEPNAVKGKDLMPWAVTNKQSAVACAIIAVEEIIRVVQHENQLDHYSKVLNYLKSKL